MRQRRPYLLRDLEERIARHVLNPRVKLVHELEQFVHHGAEELPVRPEEARVLPDDVHDVGRHHRLVVLAPLHLAQVKQVLKQKQTKKTFKSSRVHPRHLFVCLFAISAQCVDRQLLQQQFHTPGNCKLHSHQVFDRRKDGIVAGRGETKSRAALLCLISSKQRVGGGATSSRQ